MNIQEQAKKFVDIHTGLLNINDGVLISKFGQHETMRALEERFLGIDGLGSSGLQAEGFLEGYEREVKRRSNLVEKLVQIRIQVGQENQE